MWSYKVEIREVGRKKNKTFGEIYCALEKLGETN